MHYITGHVFFYSTKKQDNNTCSILLFGPKLGALAHSNRPAFFIAGRAALRGGQAVQHWIKVRPVFFKAGCAALRDGQVVQHWS